MTMFFAGLVSLNANYEVYKDIFESWYLFVFSKVKLVLFSYPGLRAPNFCYEPGVTRKNLEWNQQQALNNFSIY